DRSGRVARGGDAMDPALCPGRSDEVIHATMPKTHVAHTVEELSQQVSDVGRQLRALFRRIDAAPRLPEAVRVVGSSSALREAVHRVYHRRGLTPREIQVCELLIRGYADQEIARALGTGVGTIKTHAARVCQKLDLD